MRDLNIAIVNYHSKNDAIAAVSSLIRDMEQCPFDVQITIVDNSGNRDGIKDELKYNFPTVQYLDSGDNVGFGRGTNIGFKAAPARYYFALNADVIIPDNSRVIEKIIRFMDGRSEIGAIGPKLVNHDGSLQYTCFRFDLPSLLIKPLKQLNFDKKHRWAKRHVEKLEMRDFDHNETRPVDWVLGAAIVVRGEAVEQIGWFDEKYFMYMEDCDWCRVLWDRGWPVYYVHDIAIKHGHARDSARVPGIFRALFANRLARIHLASWFKYLWKWRGKHRYYAKLS